MAETLPKAGHVAAPSSTGQNLGTPEHGREGRSSMRKTGIVKSFRTKNGCGFILSPEGDVFVHFTNILDNDGEPGDLLIPGERVEYEVFESRRGLAALRVQRLDPVNLPTRSGRINRLFEARGFGFIDSPEGDVFFHYADTLFEGPQVGEQVDYLLATINGRNRALKVRRHKYNG